MNTPAHLIFGLAAFGRATGRPDSPPDAGRITAAALLGALLPDLSLYLLVGYELGLRGTDPRVVFDELYFSPTWQAIFRVDNSIILWGIGCALAVWTRTRWAVALTGAALLHLALDLPLHAGDGRPHFWPVATWIFDSPLSYWDGRHHAGIIGPLEIGVSLALCLVLWRRFRGWAMRALIVALGLAEAAPTLVWAIVFSGS